MRKSQSSPVPMEGVVSGVLATVGALRALLLLRRPAHALSPRSKLVLFAKVALFAVSTGIAVAWAYTQPPPTSWALSAPPTLAIFTLLTAINHTRERTSDPVILIAWPLAVLYSIYLFVLATSTGEKSALAMPAFSFHVVILVFGTIAWCLEQLGVDIGVSLDEDVKAESPLVTANIFSKWTFEWMTPLMKKGSSHYIDTDDLPPLLPSDEARALGARLKERLEKHSLTASLALAYGGPYATAAVLKVMQDLLSFSQPQLLRWLLAWITAYGAVNMSDTTTAALAPVSWRPPLAARLVQPIENTFEAIGFAPATYHLSLLDLVATGHELSVQSKMPQDPVFTASKWFSNETVVETQSISWDISSSEPATTTVPHLPLPSKIEGFAIALLMFVAGVAQTVLLNQYFQRTYETGMRVRAGLVTAIYAKALRLAPAGNAGSSGDTINLMSVDATRVQDVCGYGLIAISGPVQITLAFVSLYNLLGWSAFVGVAIMILAVPGNTFIAAILKRMQEAQMKNRDRRTRLMSELLANIRSIKLYSWESAFIRRVLEVRNSQELVMLRKIGIVTAFSSTLWSGVPLLVGFASLACASVFSGRPLTADIIFPALSLFMLLQFPLAMVANVTTSIVEAMVSIRRLNAFFNTDEIQSDARTIVEGYNSEPAFCKTIPEGRLLDVEDDDFPADLEDPILNIENAEFWWTRPVSTENGSDDVSKPTLENISLSVRRGELVGVLGRVGAGKTSILSAIIGEMYRSSGSLMLRTMSIAYAPQNPWVLSATVRENILFSHAYESEFYERVLDACALRQDIAVLPKGDQTEVGEKGITLSGGQRARIALARAVYARADLVLLDDVLAAVDSHVARHVFDQVIGPHGLLAGSARILVTHSIAFLSQMDSLVYVKQGAIVECGSYEQLVVRPRGEGEEESEIGRLVRGHGHHASGTSTPYVSGSGSATPTPPSETTAVMLSPSASALSIKLRDIPSPRLETPNTLSFASATRGATKEHSEKGRVKPRVYLQYIAAASRISFALFVLAMLLQQVVSVAASLILRAWAEHNRATGSNDGMMFYLAAYGGFSLGSVLLGFAGSVLIWVYCALRSARGLHDQMLISLMHAPLSFFELTPTGRVLNLFSRDTYVVDQILARLIQMLVRTIATCLCILIVIGAAFPPFLIAVIPLSWFYLRVMKYYLATSRELKRLDAVTRSPIFAWFSESLSGLSTIRAFGQQAIFAAINEHRIDSNQICYLPSISVNRWLQVRLEFVGSLIILIVALLSCTALVTTGVDAGLVGLVLSYALNTTSALNWVIRTASEVEQNIVSVERILHQIEVAPEAPHEIPGAIPVAWPKSGAIDFRNYSTRYRPELDLVLKNIDVSIRSAEKLGIVGRTGSGKSTLLLSLFRVIEPAEGTIFLDGVDITKIGLHGLRSSISIVPQSPDLFEGTLRDNIDPVGEHQDSDIWVALEQTHLKGYVESLPEKLDAPVREGGQSLSSGQRQLLCFARALLRKTKVLVLDEATSAVDLDTDQAVQDIIHGPAFKDVTILTIAHRLNTIMGADRILVMESGKVVELDSPANLLADNSSMFYSLANEANLIGSSQEISATP